MGDTSDLFPGYENIEDYTKATLQTVAQCTKAVMGIPAAGKEFEFYSTFKQFRALMAKEKATILSLMQVLIPSSALQENFAELDVEEQFDVIKDVNASYLETIGTLLDEAANPNKSGETEELVLTSKTSLPITTSWNKRFSTGSPKKCTLATTKNIVRPQLSFKDKVDNSHAPFEPIIQEKSNALKPLAILLETFDGVEEYSHPYEFEIEKFQPSNRLLQQSEPKSPRNLAETPLIQINTPNELKELVSLLKKQKEFAVDVEHHSYRTFQGISCLIQISTRDTDYIIDALQLRSDLHILNEAFTDPKIVKVLHGANMDVLWLQRDFGIYIVNMFDTGQAARVLNFAHLSLSYLLKYFCKHEVDKKFQLADWRIRPLPSELLKYAREDTHYLLYIYDCLKNMLLKKDNGSKNLLLSVFQRSKDICLKKYEKPIFNDQKYMELHAKSRKDFNSRNLFCLKQLYAWRDKIARDLDESYGYVLPNHMMLEISEKLPREQQGIVACCNPVPPLVRQYLAELNTIVLQAINLPVQEVERPADTEQSLYTELSEDLTDVITDIHDMHSYDDPRLSSGTEDKKIKALYKNFKIVAVPIKAVPSLQLGKKSIQVYNAICKKTSLDVTQSIDKNNRTPFERYTLTLEHRSSIQNIQDDDRLDSTETDAKYFIEHIDTPGRQIQSNVGDDVICERSGQEDQSEEDTPVMLKEKKKRKKKKQQAQIIIDDSPSKKQKTSSSWSKEAVAPNFKPYDYSQITPPPPQIIPPVTKPRHVHTRPLIRSVREPEKSGNKGQGKSSGKKRHSPKQMTYNPGKKDSNSKKWPKM